MNKCCYCRQEVLNPKDGYISSTICFHNLCLKKKFKRTYSNNNAEHIVFYEG